ncbi:MAG: hypothetical protein QS748_11030 [Candidatus Endonucleobacter bathymodioli]|uniref:Uncharacterized protein n=1 Tax=Candidatus Endonucleibacter bathymodioli TaxID=539814 RepID=A0AA90STJ3_9GAMM|nr:hypothetical protein [Candidatus Endonucleobacter bathymodioli]
MHGPKNTTNITSTHLITANQINQDNAGQFKNKNVTTTTAQPTEGLKSNNTDKETNNKKIIDMPDIREISYHTALERFTKYSGKQTDSTTATNQSKITGNEIKTKIGEQEENVNKNNNSSKACEITSHPHTSSKLTSSPKPTATNQDTDRQDSHIKNIDIPNGSTQKVKDLISKFEQGINKKTDSTTNNGERTRHTFKASTGEQAETINKNNNHSNTYEKTHSQSSSSKLTTSPTPTATNLDTDREASHRKNIEIPNDSTQNVKDLILKFEQGIDKKTDSTTTINKGQRKTNNTPNNTYTETHNSSSSSKLTPSPELITTNKDTEKLTNHSKHRPIINDRSMSFNDLRSKFEKGVDKKTDSMTTNQEKITENKKTSNAHMITHPSNSLPNQHKSSIISHNRPSSAPPATPSPNTNNIHSAYQPSPSPQPHGPLPHQGTERISTRSSFTADKPTTNSSEDNIITGNSSNTHKDSMIEAKMLIEAKVKLELISSASTILKDIIAGKSTSSDLVIFVSIKGKRIQISPPGTEFMKKSNQEQKNILENAKTTLSKEKHTIIEKDLHLKKETTITKAIQVASERLAKKALEIAKITANSPSSINNALKKHEANFHNREEITIGKFTFKQHGKIGATDLENKTHGSDVKITQTNNNQDITNTPSGEIREKNTEILDDDTKINSTASISEPALKHNHLVGSLKPYLLNSNISIKEQAIDILETAKKLISANHNLTGVAITYSANHDQTENIISTYNAGNWKTGTSGKNQAKVMSQIETLLHTADYKDLQNKFRIAPISTMATNSTGIVSSTPDQVDIGLNYIKTELIDNGWHVLGWQNQDTTNNTKAPYAIGGGVAKNVTDAEILDHIQSKLKNLSTLS